MVSNKDRRTLRSERGGSAKRKSMVKRNAIQARARPASGKPGKRPYPLPSHIRQPPFNAGTADLGFGVMNHLQSMQRNNDMWKFNHYYTPNMMGHLGHPSFNLERPKSFYHTMIKVDQAQAKAARRPSTPRLRVNSRSALRTAPTLKPAQSEDHFDTALVAEVKELREQIQDRGEHGMDEAIQKMQVKQMEQRRSLLDAIEQQKQMMVERQRQERERARAERDGLMMQMRQQQQQQKKVVVK